MPKQKTNRAAAKRFKVTSNGRVLYKKKGLRHILTKKNSKRKQDLRKRGQLSPPEQARVRKLLRS